MNLPWTHWGRVTHICVSDLTSIGSDNGLSPGWCQAIIRTNAEILLIRPLGTNFSYFLVEILIFSFKKMRLKVSSAKSRPFCLSLNELIIWVNGSHESMKNYITKTKHSTMVWWKYSMGHTPVSKVHGANMGPIWGRQDPGGPHVGPMNLAIWDCLFFSASNTIYIWIKKPNLWAI